MVSEKRLPEDLRRLRVECLRRQGLLNEAIESARADWEWARSWESLVTLLEVQAQHGDFSGMVDSAGALLDFAGGDAMQLLRVVELVRVKDTELARILWRRAVVLDAEDPHFPMGAFMSGIALGFQEELKPLNAPFMKLQALPRNAQPVTDPKAWPSHDEAWVDVVNGLRLGIAELSAA